MSLIGAGPGAVERIRRTPTLRGSIAEEQFPDPGGPATGRLFVPILKRWTADKKEDEDFDLATFSFSHLR